MEPDPPSCAAVGFDWEMTMITHGQDSEITQNTKYEISGYMRITSEFIEAGRSTAGGYSKKQLALIGVDWPPVKGWKRSVIGQEISTRTGEEFIRLRLEANRSASLKCAEEASD